MTQRSRAEDSNPLSTIDEIQRRLLRPPSLHSSEHFRGLDSPQFKVSTTRKEAKAIETTDKKLEDYLDPSLLSVISAKIGARVKEDTPKKPMKREFEWPVDELKVFIEDSRISCRNDETINLNDDSDSIKDGGERQGVTCTPFGRFELTALKRFKG
ncbi:hypothetical protein CFOL_v3_12972 [Cephalotus follicularis]|uniref:Uncharacterized protein n=1 Tax=Cephalotus follicularis TaxID=3775 RepID=A0A1Q3BN68_CEPFO|nr:hypothetical protein CFOL_v3_12972 [Cephalotus follicularis]